MQFRLPLAPLTALALVLSAGVAAAAPPGQPLVGQRERARADRGVEWYDVRDHAAARAAPAPTPRAAAERFLQGATADLGLEGVELQFQSELQASGARTVRFTQTHRGLPVIGGAVAVRLGPDGAARAAVLDVTRGLSVSTDPQISEAAAREAVEGSLGMSLMQDPAIRLAVLPDGDGAGRLVWMVDIHRATRRAMRYLVDAHAGGLVGLRPLALDALGRVYEIDRVTTPDPVDVTLTGLVASTPQMLTGWNGNLIVTNYVSGGQQAGYTVEQTLTPSGGEDFLYDPPASDTDFTDGFAQVNVYHHMTRIHDYFATERGVDMTPATWKVTAVANLGEDGQGMDNAFFAPDAASAIDAPYDSPNMMGIGQGTQFDFADDSDVFLHEFGHYVSHNAIGYNLGQLGTNEYGISPWSGGIDEGIADYFACSLNGNAILGEASLAKLGAEYARDLTNTTAVCPDSVIGEVHEDGKIIGSLGWTLRTELGQQLGDALVWNAMQTLTPGASLGDFGRGLMQAAEDLMTAGQLTAAQVQTVTDAVAARGLDDCDHVLGVTETQSRVINWVGLELVGALVGVPCSLVQGAGVSLQSFFHFSAQGQPGADGLRFRVQLSGPGADLSWSIYGRSGSHVALAGSGSIPIPVPTQYDYVTQGLTGTEGELVIDANSDPPFDPNQTYYIVLMNQHCPTAQATISVEHLSGAGGAGGAGGGGVGGGGTGGQGGDETTSDPTDEDSGCGCRVAGESAPAGGRWAALLGLGLAAAALRRRRGRA